jgi:hypothetical protein
VDQQAFGAVFEDKFTNYVFHVCSRFRLLFTLARFVLTLALGFAGFFAVVWCDGFFGGSGLFFGLKVTFVEGIVVDGDLVDVTNRVTGSTGQLGLDGVVQVAWVNGLGVE